MVNLGVEGILEAIEQHIGKWAAKAVVYVVTLTILSACIGFLVQLAYSAMIFFGAISVGKDSVSIANNTFIFLTGLASLLLIVNGSLSARKLKAQMKASDELRSRMEEQLAVMIDMNTDEFMALAPEQRLKAFAKRLRDLNLVDEDIKKAPPT